jgi:PAS domain S-box-containing protein
MSIPTSTGEPGGERSEEARRGLAAIVEASDDAIISKTLEGIVLSWNRGATNLFGYEAEEMIGRSISLLVPPGRAEEEPTILQASAEGKVQRFDTVRRRKGGKEIDVSVTISPIHDGRGRVVAICKIARDITAQKRAGAELARAKEKAEAANQELRSFSYSIAHDLRAPLRGIDGFAQALLEEHSGSLDADGADYLNEIRSNAQRMGALIDALLALAQVTRSDLDHVHLDLSRLFRGAAEECASLEPDRSVEVIVADGLVARGDLHLTRSLFANLVGNAWKFTRGKATARIELALIDRHGQKEIVVRDDGAGFDMAYASKLFQPFQRLHSRSEFPGTGIGLATVHRIVQRHGGTIRAEGKVGQGAAVFFTLPELGEA